MITQEKEDFQDLLNKRFSNYSELKFNHQSYRVKPLSRDIPTLSNVFQSDDDSWIIEFDESENTETMQLEDGAIVLNRDENGLISGMEVKIEGNNSISKAIRNINKEIKELKSSNDLSEASKNDLESRKMMFFKDVLNHVVAKSIASKNS